MSKRKKGFRKIPSFIEARRDNLGDRFRIAGIKRITKAEIEAGRYAHLGLSWNSNQLAIQTPAIPPAEFGLHAKRNILGHEIVRRDLPKIDKTITFINPRLFGRPGNRCQITQTRRVYVRDHLPPRMYAIKASLLAVEGENHVIHFDIAWEYSALDPNADRELLFCLNMLQESVGDANVFAPDATVQDYLGSIHVHWEILPSGQRDTNVSLILSSLRPKSQEEREALQELIEARYGFLETLKPKHLIRGAGGMGGYLGAMIDDDKVVFDHLTPGNGVYIMFKDWAAQSQRTKTDLLKNAQEGKDFIRIFHTGDWQNRVREAIAA